MSRSLGVIASISQVKSPRTEAGATVMLSTMGILRFTLVKEDVLQVAKSPRTARGWRNRDLSTMGIQWLTLVMVKED